MKFMSLVLLVISFLLSACASGPTMEEMQQAVRGFNLESESEGDRVDVYIYYLHNDGKRMVFGDVTYFLDGSAEPAGAVGFGEYIHIQTTPGTHEIAWQGAGKSLGSRYRDTETFNLEKGKTYIFRQVHDVMFNRYASDGLSVISTLRPAKNLTQGKYYMRKAKKRE